MPTYGSDRSKQRACKHRNKTPLTHPDAIAALLADRPQDDAINEVMIDALQTGIIEPVGCCTECGTPVFRGTDAFRRRVSEED